MQRTTIHTISDHKGKQPFVCLTAYTAPFTKIIDPHVDILLVGDSLGMVLYGMDSTLPVTVEMMVNHGKAVVQSSQHALVVVDMPFGSYQTSKEQAFEHAAHIMAYTGCQAIKLEGGEEMAETIAFITARGIPVMGHIGLMPQHKHLYGGFRVQGKTPTAYDKILNDAKAIEQAGAFSTVIEGVKEPLAQEITKTLTIPTIGIGASAHCDGQILVTEDMLGLLPDFCPKFVKQYSNLAQQIETAVASYAKDVKTGAFPAKEHCFD